VTVSIALSVIHAAWSPARRVMMMDLERKIGGRSVIESETVGYRVSKDMDKRGVWPPAKAAWQFVASTSATHGLVIQDDAIPCTDFLKGVRQAISERPDDPICYWSMRRNIISRARDQGSSWFTSADAVMGIALSMPVPMISDFLCWQAQHVDPALPDDDRRLCLYLVYGAKRRLWTTVPSLVEHAAPSESLLGNGNSRRVATWWADGTSATTIDWSQGASSPPHDSQRTIGSVTMSGFRP
jgi:hypothetical protein